MNVLIEPMELSFPIKQAKVKISSSWLDRLEELTKFVFKMVANGNGEEEISKVTRLQKYLILEEIHRLQDWGLLETDNKLTDLGANYNELIEIIESFNREQMTFYVNTFNGQVILEEKVFVTESRGEKMKSNVTWVQTKGANFSDVQEQFRQKYLFTHPSSIYLSKDAIEAIDVWLEIDPTFTLYYVKRINSLEDFSYSVTRQSSDDILIRLTVPSLNVRFNHLDLIKHKNVLSTLGQLEQYDASLLSTHATSLIQLNELYISKFKRKKMIYYWNPVSNQFSKEFKEQTRIRTKDYEIKISCTPSIEQLLRERKEEMTRELSEGFKTFIDSDNSMEKIYRLHSCSKKILEELYE